MIDYEVLRFLWWLLLGVLLAGFAVMDGFDLGVAAIHRFVGRNDEERRVLLATIEPVWDGNQVWLILGGGAVFAAFPMLYAAAFSGLYFAILLLLLALILRPVGLNFRDKLADPRWRNVWDWALCVSGALPALLFGVAFGNLFLGLPFEFDALRRPIYSGGFFDLLHPFALLAGLASLSMLVMHGATYAALKTEAPLADRAIRVAMSAALCLVLAMTLCGLWLALSVKGYRIEGVLDHAGPSNPLLKTVQTATGAWLDNFSERPILGCLPVAIYAASTATALLLRVRRTGLAFIASAIVQVSVVFTAGVSLFPFLMPSSSAPSSSLTIWDASSSQATLFTMLIAALIFVPIVLMYTAWVFRVLRGKTTLDEIRQHTAHY